MVSTNQKITYIDAGVQDMSRPKERPPKSNWKLELVKKGVGVIQHISPKTASEIVWYHFTKPGRSKFTEAQEALIEKAEVKKTTYFGHDIVTYKWGTKGPKILLSHGWNSKTADFRRMIEALVAQGFVVEGIDMKAHGKSSGKHTALPEIRDILKNYYIKNGPYQTVIGYSIGGLAAGIFLSELSKKFHPEQLFIIAAPSHTRYFFEEIIKELGYSEKVYREFCDLVVERYHQSVDYFDMRTKKDELGHLKTHLIYDENDQTVPFNKGLELKEIFQDSAFVHTKGLGHYKVISFPEVIDYVARNVAEPH